MAKFWIYFGKYCLLLGKISLLKISKYWKNIQPSGHTGPYLKPIFEPMIVLCFERWKSLLNTSVLLRAANKVLISKYKGNLQQMKHVLHFYSMLNANLINRSFGVSLFKIGSVMWYQIAEYINIAFKGNWGQNHSCSNQAKVRNNTHSWKIICNNGLFYVQLIPWNVVVKWPNWNKIWQN